MIVRYMWSRRLHPRRSPCTIDVDVLEGYYTSTGVEVQWGPNHRDGALRVFFIIDAHNPDTRPHLIFQWNNNKGWHANDQECAALGIDAARLRADLGDE